MSLPGSRKGRPVSQAILQTPKTGTVFPVLGAVSFCHMLNDMMQALLPAVYSILRGDFSLSFAQIGTLTLVYQITASILQPMIGFYTDSRPQPYSLPFAMLASMAGLLTLAFAPSYGMLLVGASMLGLGSSIFHPESSRIARLSSGGAHGLAQSVFQVGGNFGSALGPLLAAYIVLPRGQSGLAWFSVAALGGMFIMTGLSHWYRSNGHARRPAKRAVARHPSVTSAQARLAMTVLVVLIFSKYIYLASITNYYTFYMMHRFGLTTQSAQVCQFVFFAAVATGTIIGGPVGDRIGRKKVIWASILGVLPYHPGTALCRVRGDHRAQHRHRCSHLLGLPSNRGLRPGAYPGADGDDLRPVLRADLRCGRHWRRGAWQPRRPLWHRLRLPALLLPAGNRTAHGAAAKYREHRG